MSPLLAVARNFCREVQRRATTAPFILMILLSSALLPRLAGEDSSLQARLQVAVTYGVGFPVLLIALFTIAAAAGLAREIESKRIQLLVTKPLPAWQILAGRLIGVAAVDTLLLGLVLASFAVQVRIEMARASRTPEETAQAVERFFTPRAGIPAESTPSDPQRVRAVMEALRSGDAGAFESEGGLEAVARAVLRRRTLPPGASTELVVRGIPQLHAAAEKSSILVEFVAHSQDPSAEPRFELEWSAAGSAGAVVSRALHGVPQQIAVPLAAGPDGTLRITARNPAAKGGNGPTLLLDPLQVEALVPEGSFVRNVASAFFVVLLECWFLAAASVCLGAIFTFPTSVLTGLFVYGAALSAGFLRETLDLFAADAHSSGILPSLESWLVALGSGVLRVVPSFARLDPLERVAAARSIAPAELGAAIGSLGVVGAAIPVAVGAWILRRRELGRAE